MEYDPNDLVFYKSNKVAMEDYTGDQIKVILEVNDSSDYFVGKTEVSMNKARMSGKLRGDGEGGVLLISTKAHEWTDRDNDSQDNHLAT